MAEFSDYMENKILNSLRNVAGVQVAAYVALFNDSATPAELEAGTLTNELSGNGYARELAGLSEATGAGGSTSNAADITFTTATGDWGTVHMVALMDAVSAGNVLMHSILDADKTVGNGDTFKINSTELTVTVA